MFVGCTCLLCASLWWVYSYQTICSASAGVLSQGFADVTIAYTQLEKGATNVCWRYWFWKYRIWAKVHFEPHLEQCNLTAHGECVIRLVRCNSCAAEWWITEWVLFRTILDASLVLHLFSSLNSEQAWPSRLELVYEWKEHFRRLVGWAAASKETL